MREQSGCMLALAMGCRMRSELGRSSVHSFAEAARVERPGFGFGYAVDKCNEQLDWIAEVGNMRREKLGPVALVEETGQSAWAELEVEALTGRLPERQELASPASVSSANLACRLTSLEGDEEHGPVSLWVLWVLWVPCLSWLTLSPGRHPSYDATAWRYRRHVGRLYLWRYS